MAKLQAAGEPGQIKTVQTTPQTGEKEPPDSLAAVTSLGLDSGRPHVRKFLIKIVLEQYTRNHHHYVETVHLIGLLITSFTRQIRFRSE